jgi:hypothetical protein
MHKRNLALNTLKNVCSTIQKNIYVGGTTHIHIYIIFAIENTMNDVADHAQDKRNV